MRATFFTQSSQSPGGPGTGWLRGPSPDADSRCPARLFHPGIGPNPRKTAWRSLIAKNDTGDRLNFGLAAERARTFGLKVNMVIVQDDIAIPGISRPRGVAGTLIVHKQAGAVFENGGDLDAVTTAVQRAAAGVMTIGMSLDTCTVPGAPKEDRFRPGKIELGLGIHGEPVPQSSTLSMPAR